MATSSRLPSETAEPPSPEPALKLVEGRQRSFFYEKPVALSVLILLALGQLYLLPIPVGWGSSQREQARVIRETGRYDPDGSYVQFNQPAPIEDIGDIFIRTELLPLPEVPEAAFLSVPEPGPTLQPRATVIPRLKDIPPPQYTLSTAIPWPTLPATPTPIYLPSTVTPAPTSSPTPLPTLILQPGIDHIVIISVDGLRPDAIVAADAPNLDRLINQGTYFPEAQTVKTSITLPGHASMVSGMIPEKHGILWNAPYIGWPGMNGPTLFSVAHEAGFSTAMVFGKEKLNYLVLPNSVDKLFGTDVHDPEIRNQALEFIEEGLTDILFIHFPDVDRVGHAYGWMSPNQFDAIAYVDGLIGEIVAKLEAEGYLRNTLLIITADHGGHDFGHGDDSPLDRTVPWLAVGPEVPAGVIQARHINTYDTAATVLYILDLPLPETWDGQPIGEIFPD